MNRKQRRADAKSGAQQAPSPPSPEHLLYSAALGHYQAGRYAQAQPLLLHMISANPRDHDALNLLGAIAFETLPLEVAEDFFHRALAVRPNESTAHCNLGNALHHQAKYTEALPSLRRAVRLSPHSREALVSLGHTLRALGQLDEAIAAYRKAVALDPQSAEAHYALSTALLTQGDFTAGWQEHEWRWQTSHLCAARLEFVQPQWRGEAAPGKTLLIYDEQGFGDSLQFCRFVPLAAAQGLRVILSVPPGLLSLFKSLPGVDHLVTHGNPLPDFDLHCPMMSLPLAFGTTLETIPDSIPYLHADPQAIADFQSRLGPATGKRIGLVWAGNPRKEQRLFTLIDSRRSIDATLLAPLFEIPGAQFISLQKAGPAAPAHFPLTDLMPDVQDFAGTAALIANLDLVICVDSSVAHLAGALGKPLWLLDRYDHCWRWLAGRSTSPWYPAMRIYRQKSPGDWRGVISEVSRHLQSFSAQDKS